LLGVEIFGWLPMLAGVAMAMSSVTVVGNSILLGRYKPMFKAENKKLSRTDNELEAIAESKKGNPIRQSI
jgi:hypothetical protein